jgi:hypothetical protein
MIRSFLALSLLFFAAVSHADIVSEHPVSTIVYGPAPGQQYGASAASDGRDFLVAWVESRNRSGVTQIYAARMNAAGEILDPLGIRIAAVSNQLTGVNVVFLGNAYLVYWTEPPSGVGSVPALMAARISRDGVLIDSLPRILATPSSFGAYTAASNGNRTVIVLHGAKVAAVTIVLDRDGNVVAGPKTFTNIGVTSAMVVSNGRGFLIAWSLGGSIYETLLDDAGVVTAPGTMTLSRDSYLYDLASDGDGYVAVVGDGTHVFAQHVSVAGELLERSAVPMQQYIPGFVFANGSYLLMDSDPKAQSIGVRRLDRTGKPVGDYSPLAQARIDGPGFSPLGTLASNGSDTAAFWTELRASGRTVHGGILHANAAELTKPGAIARSANAQYAPRAATNGRNIAVVWNESDGVYAGRLTLDGQMLDGRGIRISDAGGGADIVFDGTNYLIAWAERSAGNLASSVKVTRLFPDFGTVLDPAGITVASSPCVNALSLSVGSASTLVAWSDCKHILANTVDKIGVVGTATVVTPPETKETAGVSAAWNGREWLVAWDDRISIPTPIQVTYTQTFIKAARLSASLTLLDPRPILLTDTTWDVTPFVASDGNAFLVTWTLPIYAMAQRISADGSLLGPANGVRIGRGYVTDVVWDGRQYDVAFSSFSYGRLSTLYITHVAAGGPIEGTGAQAVVSNDVTPNAKLIVTSPGKVVAAYSLVAADAIFGAVERVFVNAPHAIRERAVELRSNP